MVRPTFQVELEYTRHLESVAIQKLRVHSADYGPTMAKVLSETNLSFAAGVFEWGMPQWSLSLDSPTNMEELGYLVARVKSPGLRRDRWNEIWKSKWKVEPGGRRINEIAEALWALIHSPNFLSPDQTNPGASVNP